MRRTLAKVPLWAVDAACLEVVRSGAKFAPSAPELILMAEGYCAPFRAEQGQIRRVLDAEVWHEPSAEEKARIQAGFAKLMADLRMNEPYDKPRKDWRPVSPLERLAELRDAAEPAPALSDAALAKVGARRTEEAA
jgi:hypothetical protein